MLSGAFLGAQYSEVVAPVGGGRCLDTAAVGEGRELRLGVWEWSQALEAVGGLVCITEVRARAWGRLAGFHGDSKLG
jgi:hypothetical protein